LNPHLRLSLDTKQDIAIGSLYLSSKLTESQLRLRDLLNVYLLYVARNEHLRTRLQTQTRDQGRELDATEHQGQAVEDDRDPMEGFEYTPPSFHSPVYYELKDVVVVAEMQILKRLGFHVQVSLVRTNIVSLGLPSIPLDSTLSLSLGLLRVKLDKRIRGDADLD
jgi:hypothetical protein